MDANRGFFVHVDLRSHENNRAHRTEEIDRERLIVRRGQPFAITVQCSNTYSPKQDVALALNLDKNNQVMIRAQRERGASGEWWFSQQWLQGEILLNLHSPADAPVGQYCLAVLAMSPDGHVLEKTQLNKFYLLFNPWCKADAVYLPDEHHIQEYVMNEDGSIYTGTQHSIHSLPWNFGQFEDNVVDICFEILDNSAAARKDQDKDVKNRSDPVYVSRTVTAMVNSADDDGVLRGNWQPGPYLDGVAPTHWTGSVPILQRWSQSGKKEVKYGQCWVFAGVACTVLRCLGIPTRCITNFVSAHDVDGNLSVDVLFNERMERMRGDDSSWNFHCWVESWMRRDDLPKGNDGWQVLDPTPQERSEGVYCCGPCPVKAIKEGNLNLKYDAPFVFAEVNADVVQWMVLADGQRRQIRSVADFVGVNISTKSVDGYQREDVTLEYKYPEGTRREREVYEKAGRSVSRPNTIASEPGLVLLKIKHATPVFGTDFDIVFELENVGGQDVSATLTMLCQAITYNAVPQGECQRRTANVVVPAHEVHREVLHLRYKQYATCITEHHVIKVTGMVEVSGENEPILETLTIQLVMPEIVVLIPGRPVLYQQTRAKISFTNPLPVTLRGGVFTVEGAGLLLATEVHVPQDISPGQEVSVTVFFTPVRPGVRRLLVDFNSDLLRNVKGAATMVVRKKTPFSAFNIFG